MADLSVFLKFDPEKIQNAGMNLENRHKRFVQSIERIRKCNNSLQASWKGDSADEYIKKVNDLDMLVEDLEVKLLQLSQDLAAASGVYKAGETQATQRVESLPTDGIFKI